MAPITAVASVRSVPGGGGPGQVHESDVTRDTTMHPQLMYDVADLGRREQLQEQTRRRSSLRRVTTRLPEHTRRSRRPRHTA